jgi:hypothetical protein
MVIPDAHAVEFVVLSQNPNAALFRRRQPDREIATHFHSLNCARPPLDPDHDAAQ